MRLEIATQHPFLDGVFQLGAKYGEAPVAIAFEFGAGDVLHMISHYCLQRTELRSERHISNWTAYAAEVGATDIAADAAPQFDDLTVGEVESAHKSLRFMTNAVAAKRRRETR